MFSSPNPWYVQTDFGAMLGPMPADALSELARTGALLPRDQVREGIDGDWRLASDWPGLFDQSEQPLPHPETLQEPAPPHESFKITSSVRLLDDLMKPEKAAVKHRPMKPGEKPPDELAFELNVPPPVPAAQTPAVVESRTVNKIKTSAAPAVAPQAEPVEVSVPAPPPFPAFVAEPRTPTDRTTGWTPPSSRPVRRGPTAGKPDSSPHLWRRMLPAAAAIAVVLALMTVWWVWPRQRPDIYTRYVAIYEELQQRRGKTQDQAGWNEFVTRSNAHLNDVLPWLEDRAKPGDREKSLLLYVGRDLQDLLDQPRDSEPIHQERLKAFFEQLQEMYGSAK